MATATARRPSSGGRYGIGRRCQLGLRRRRPPGVRRAPPSPVPAGSPGVVTFRATVPGPVTAQHSSVARSTVVVVLAPGPGAPPGVVVDVVVVVDGSGRVVEVVD